MVPLCQMVSDQYIYIYFSLSISPCCSDVDVVAVRSCHLAEKLVESVQNFLFFSLPSTKLSAKSVFPDSKSVESLLTAGPYNLSQTWLDNCLCSSSPNTSCQEAGSLEIPCCSNLYLAFFLAEVIVRAFLTRSPLFSGFPGFRAF